MRFCDGFAVRSFILLVRLSLLAVTAAFATEYERGEWDPPFVPHPPVDAWWLAPFVVELVEDGSFESGSFEPAWNVIKIGLFGNWYATDQLTGPESGRQLQPPCDGDFQAVADQVGTGVHILYQDVSIPGGSTSVAPSIDRSPLAPACTESDSRSL